MEHTESKRYGLLKNIGRSLSLAYRHNKRNLIAKIIVSIITSVLPVVASWYSAVFINKAVSGEYTSIYDPSLLTVALFYIGLLVISPLFQVLYKYLDDTFFISFSQYFEILFVKKRGEIDIQKYEDPKFNDLINRVNENFGKLFGFTEIIIYVFENLIRIALALFAIATYKWWIALIIFLSIIPDFLIEIKYGQTIYGIWGARSEIKRKFYENRRHFMNIPSLVELKIFKSKDFFLQHMNDLLGIFNKEIKGAERAKTKSRFYATLFTFAIGGIVIFILLNDIVAQALAIGTFVFVLGQIGTLRESLKSFFFNTGKLYSDNLFISDVFKLLNTEQTLKNGSESLSDSTPEITFTDVTFSYPGTDRVILKNINVTIQKGEKVAIVGVNGAGKTTLTKLIARFYDPTEGEIKLDGINLQDIDINEYYSKLGILSQEYAKYRTTIQEAIALGDPSVPVDIDRVIHAAEESGAHEFIQEWKNGYDTQLGKEFEDGVEPSIGQWQKIALARMFYKNPQIWILDEPTASIDAIAEMSIFEKLESLPKDKTVILISHRFNTVKNADKIIVIENGEIAEIGSHKELFVKNGIYHNLFTLQKGSYEEKEN